MLHILLGPHGGEPAEAPRSAKVGPSVVAAGCFPSVARATRPSPWGTHSEQPRILAAAVSTLREVFGTKSCGSLSFLSLNGCRNTYSRKNTQSKKCWGSSTQKNCHGIGIDSHSLYRSGVTTPDMAGIGGRIRMVRGNNPTHRPAKKCQMLTIPPRCTCHASKTDAPGVGDRRGQRPPPTVKETKTKMLHIFLAL